MSLTRKAQPPARAHSLAICPSAYLPHPPALPPALLPACPARLQLFLEQNEDEAGKMAEKEDKQREIEKSNIKVGAGWQQGAAAQGGRRGGMGAVRWQRTGRWALAAIVACRVRMPARAKPPTQQPSVCRPPQRAGQEQDEQG